MGLSRFQGAADAELVGRSVVLPAAEINTLPPHLGGGQVGPQPHTSLDRSTIIFILPHWASSVSTLPSSVEAKPHCGERQSWSSATYFSASLMRALMSPFFSSVPDFEVTRPSTICLLPFGTKRSGSNPPARSVSYSRQ